MTLPVISPAVASEQRTGLRRRVLKTGIIAFNDHRSTIGCVIRDLTPSGARLSVDGFMNVPDLFDLIIELEGLEASCQVAWRRAFR
jgi:hypothetical protein